MLREGEGSAALLAGEAAKLLGNDHPLVCEMFGILVEIARGNPGYRGRHIGDRLRAVRDALDRTIGRAREAGRSQHDHGALDRLLERIDNRDFEPPDGNGHGPGNGSA